MGTLANPLRNVSNYDGYGYGLNRIPIMLSSVELQTISMNERIAYTKPWMPLH